MSDSPKQFKKTEEYLPIPKEGLSSFTEFKNIEEELCEKELLRKMGLSNEEIILYEENESGVITKRNNIENSVLKDKLRLIYEKLKAFNNKESYRELPEITKPSTSKSLNKEDLPTNLFNMHYPEKHPINSIQFLERDMFGHLDSNDITSLTKRRKLLRRLQRKLERLNHSDIHSQISHVYDKSAKERNPNTLWDMKEPPKKIIKHNNMNAKIIGPKLPTMYTVKDNKIVRLESVIESQQSYRAVDIIQPQNKAEENLLEGTKLSIDDIKKIPRFKDYHPGEPAKVLFLKNISERVSQNDVTELFKAFGQQNGHQPIDVKLMTGKLRGQAFVTFKNEECATNALESVNGIILKGKPIIAQFSRKSGQKNGDQR